MEPNPLSISELSSQKIEEAVQLALKSRDEAYCPYSHFAVGAALVTADGELIPGCNVESASYSLTTCAERVAIQNAVAAGFRRFRLLVVSSSQAVTPCGACRQVLAEFEPSLDILLVDANDSTQRRRLNLSDLLPDGFSKFDLSDRP